MRKPWSAHYEAGVPSALQYPAVPLHGLLEHAAERFAERVATIVLGARATYSTRNAASNCFARALLSFGLRKGDRVALQLPNCPHFLHSALARGIP